MDKKTKCKHGRRWLMAQSVECPYCRIATLEAELNDARAERDEAHQEAMRWSSIAGAQTDKTNQLTKELELERVVIDGLKQLHQAAGRARE